MYGGGVCTLEEEEGGGSRKAKPTDRGVEVGWGGG